MPHSGPEFTNMLTSILAAFDKPNVLDVGVGAGKTARLAPAGSHLVGVEKYSLYRDMFKAEWMRYAQVFIGDALEVSLKLSRSRFDIVVMGDVLEHMWKHDAMSLIDFWQTRAGFIVCVWPNGYPQDDSGGAESEIHRTELQLSDFAGYDVVRFHKHYRKYPHASKSTVVIRGTGDKQQGVAY